MSKLASRKTKLTFETADEIRERRLHRPVVIEAHPMFAQVKLKGLRTTYNVSWASIYGLAVRQHVDALRAARKAAKKK